MGFGNHRARKLLVTGGARSGKSRFALEWGRSFHPPRLFLATARPIDAEMEERIELHRRERKDEWVTVEEPVDVEIAIKESAKEVSCLVIDCVTLWLTNLIMANLSDQEISMRVRELCKQVASAPCAVLIVTNEVGWSLVPENPLGRRFRDLVGRTNQTIAREVEEVVLMVSGIPLVIKSQATSLVSSKFNPREPRI